MITLSAILIVSGILIGLAATAALMFVGWCWLMDRIEIRRAGRAKLRLSRNGVVTLSDRRDRLRRLGVPDRPDVLAPNRRRQQMPAIRDARPDDDGFNGGGEAA